MEPLLSICIPTFNRLDVLRTCMDSVLRELRELQAPDRVEIVLSDNASSDGTEAYCQALAAAHGCIRTYRNGWNLGIGNFMAVVDQGRGTYAWLLGDDDALLPGTLGRLLDALASGHDVYLGPRIACDKDLQPVGHQAWHLGAPGADWDLGTAQERIRYFNHCANMGGLFGFMSAQVFRRASWNTVALPNGPLTGGLYPHMYRLLAFAASSLRLRLLDFPLILGRIPDLDAGSPDFHRTTKDIDSMLEVAEALGYRRNGAVWDAFFGVVRRNHNGDHYPRMIRLQAPDEATWELYRSKLIRMGYAAPYLEALDRAFHALPLGTRPLLPMPAGTDLGVTYALEHMAFLLHGVRALALVSLGTPQEAREAWALGALLKERLPGLRLLYVGTPDPPPEGLAPEDRFLALVPGALEGDPALQQRLTQACRTMEVGLALNAGHPRTRPSDLACALVPAFARLGLPGSDPRVDPLYTAVLPRETLAGNLSGCEVIRLALGI